MKTLAKKPFITYTLLFLALLLACFLTFFRKGLLPIYSIDGLGQYYPVFMYIGKTVREFFAGLFGGGQIRFYDLSVGMGEDIFGTLNYYGFGDPVNLLSAFATDSSGPFLFSFVYFLRLYLGGIAFIFFCRRFSLSANASVVAALSYVFWGYGLFASMMYTQYAAMLYVLPMLLAGCEMVFEGGRSHVLFLSALYLGLCGFYFTYICSLFLVVYCIVRCAFKFGKTGIKTAVQKCLLCALFYALGIAASLPVLLPSLFAFLESSRGTSSPISTLLTLSYYIPSLDRSFVADANIMNSVRNYPVMIAGIAVFLLPKSRRTMQLRLAVISLFVLLYLPITARIANGFADPRDRWVFIAQLMLCVTFAAVAQMLEEDAGFNKYIPAVYAAVLINIILSFALLYSGMGRDRKSMFVSADEARAEMQSVVTASSVAEDPGLFRISGDFTSKINERPKNNAMLNGYNGLTYWFSIVNSDTQEFVDTVTKKSNDWRSFGLFEDINAEDMAAVKYRFVQGEGAPEGYELTGTVDADGTSWSVYERSDFRPFAYITDAAGKAISDCSLCTYEMNTFSCVISEDAPKDGMLRTAIPYAPGWSAYVNEKKTGTTSDGHFLAIASGGLNKDDVITFRYVSPGFYEGVWACLASALIYVLIVILSFVAKRKTTRQQ